MCNRVMFAERVQIMDSMLRRLFAETKTRAMLPTGYTGFSWGLFQNAAGLGRVRVIGTPRAAGERPHFAFRWRALLLRALLE